MKRIRCITFDLDDTLWACRPVIERAERRFHAWLLGRHPMLATRFKAPETLVAHKAEFFRRHPELRHDLTRLRKRWMAQLAAEHDLGDDWIEEGFRVFWLARNEVALYDEAADLLHTLRCRFLIGAITNGNADVRHIGVDHLFDFVITAAEAGAAKPDPGIFRLALEKAGVQAGECLHVGDDLECDVLGARACGIHAVWVSPSSPMPETDELAEARVRHVRELPQLLASWGLLGDPPAPERGRGRSAH